MSGVRHYVVVTAAYWAFTLTDGALRMLVLLHFHGLGYTPVELAFLFLFYELFGVVTNLLGGWIAARMGVRVTLLAGLGLQIAALGMLSALDPAWARGASVAFVMAAQALSGVAKDLTNAEKMPREFEINMLRCIFCGYCQEVCPEEAIFLMKDYSLIGASREEMIYNKEKLLALGGVHQDKIYDEFAFSESRTQGWVREPARKACPSPARFAGSEDCVLVVRGYGKTYGVTRRVAGMPCCSVAMPSSRTP